MVGASSNPFEHRKLLRSENFFTRQSKGDESDKKDTRISVFQTSDATFSKAFKVSLAVTLSWKMNYTYVIYIVN